MRRLYGGQTLRLRRLHVRREASVETLESRAMLAADLMPEADFGPLEDSDDSLAPAPRPEFQPGSFLLEGELVDPPPVQLHFAVVTTPTEFTDPDLGSVEQLPESMLRTHEWDRYYVEVWVEGGDQVGDLSVDVDYQTDIATPRNVTFGPAFADGQFSVDDDLGEIHDLMAHAEPPAPPADGAAPATGLVLFARIEFGADGQRDNVRLDFDSGTVGPHSLGLDMVRSEAMTAEGSVLDVQAAEKPDFGLVPVIYDLNDDQTISLADLSMMIRALGADASAPDGSATWYADVNKDYAVSLIDMSYMVRNIGSNWTNERIQFPDNYPEAWIPKPEEGGGVGGTGGDGGNGGEETPPEDPPLHFVPIDVGGNALAPDPAMILALQALLQIEIVFPVGFDFTLLQGNVSYSDSDGDGKKETMLEIEVDDQLFETEIEIEIMTELIDTDQLWNDWSGAIGSYFGEVIADLKDLFLNDEE